MLKLRRGEVVAVEAADERVARLVVRIENGHERPAISYQQVTGPVEAGDEVVVNVEALDLELGSGGFDIVHANLSRLEGGGREGAHVMKLNYSSLQHAVTPLEEGSPASPPIAMPTCVLALHGQLAPVAFAFERLAGRAAGFVQTAGGALPGALSRDVPDLRERGLLSGHVSAGPCFGAPEEAITVEGALAACAARSEWPAALVGPGPGILGSASTLGHGGLAALANAHAALALGSEVVLAPRLSSGDERERHRGLSHHTEAVLSLVLAPVTVALPLEAGERSRTELRRAATAQRDHELAEVEVGALAEDYLASGLPATTMGRGFEADRDFFLAGLAAGMALARRLALA